MCVTVLLAIAIAALLREGPSGLMGLTHNPCQSLRCFKDERRMINAEAPRRELQEGMRRRGAVKEGPETSARGWHNSPPLSPSLNLLPECTHADRSSASTLAEPLRRCRWPRWASVAPALPHDRVSPRFLGYAHQSSPFASCFFSASSSDFEPRQGSSIHQSRVDPCACRQHASTTPRSA